MEQKSLFSVISPIMVGPSSSHTAGAVRLGLMARNIYKNSFSKVKFCLYNSFATTGFGHGTDKGLLAGVLGYSVDDVIIKNIFDVVENVEYSYEYAQDISRHPNSVDITFSTASSPIGMSRATYIEAVPPLELLSQWREAMLTFCFCIISLTVEIIPGRSLYIKRSVS